MCGVAGSTEVHQPTLSLQVLIFQNFEDILAQIEGEVLFLRPPFPLRPPLLEGGLCLGPILGRIRPRFWRLGCPLPIESQFFEEGLRIHGRSLESFDLFLQGSIGRDHQKVAGNRTLRDNTGDHFIPGHAVPREPHLDATGEGLRGVVPPYAVADQQESAGIPS